MVIPALHELFVENLNWLTSAEFADGIAIGQITPGPIFVTATFIGYKVAGVLGAFLATVAIFTPPAVLTVLLSRFVKILNPSVVSAIIFAAIFIISLKYTISPVYLIIASGVAGFILF